MKSVRKALRNGDIDKDTYGRLVCGECEQSLGTKNEPSEVHSVRVCPDCGTEYKELS